MKKFSMEEIDRWLTELRSDITQNLDCVEVAEETNFVRDPQGSGYTPCGYSITFSWPIIEVVEEENDLGALIL
jgi:hypothetical protein